jgi:hypothetical protein
MHDLASDLLGRAPLYINGQRLDTVGEGDARNRIAKACQQLITFAFPNLRMLKGTYDEGTLSKALLDANEILFAEGENLSESEQEILTYVQRNQNNGDRTSIEEIIRNFGRRPYGWYPMGVLTLVSRLFRMGKVELRAPEVLDTRSALTHLKNSRQHGSVRVRLHEAPDPTKINNLKSFYRDFFDRANDGVDGVSVGQFTSAALTAEARDLALLLDQAGRYPFLEALRPIAERVTKLSERDSTYLLNHVAEFDGDLLTAKDDLLSPLKAFMHGPQRIVYDDAITFLREEEANFAELDHADVQPLRDLAASAHPYRGNTLPAAKATVTKLRSRLADILKAERDQAGAELDAQVARLETIEGFGSLSESSKKQVLAATNSARSAIQTARFVTGIRDRLQRYTSQEYPMQIALAARLVAPSPKSNEAPISDAPPEPTVEYTPASGLRPKCGLLYIASRADLEQWLAALRVAAEAELDKGKRITL